MTQLLRGVVLLICLIFALFVAVNFWPLLILFLWIAVPVFLLNIFLSKKKK